MTDLPILEERRIAEMEDALFTDIARERTERSERDAATAARRRRRRRTVWVTSSAAAVVLVAAFIFAPQLTTSTGSAESAAPAPADGAGTSEGLAPFSLDEGTTGAPIREEGVEAPAEREVLTTASATVTVADPQRAAERITEAAIAAGGYVESLSVGGGTVPPLPDAATWPAPSASAWVSVRVPAANLEGVLAGLADVGEVESSQVSRDDVTTQTIDLRARVAAGQASVDRLTDLLSQAGSVADLIAAESALVERQADLESLQQQLAALESQVAFSSLSVQLDEPAAAVDADPAGFADGLAAGWNGIVAAFNAVVVGLGFALPWLAVLAVAALSVRLALAAVRRRRARRTTTTD
ncbi:DUF4349 domain-containing protein [Microbacterium imperiale]|uniref:DUF4349 domain-containing protein n=1 Tax=Microbacterium imperiale TaxID=33884 RepID=A0A9W6M2Q1_9MICO|nr:DUF4349 domain-containing protein [Microbacterium imperiale]MBP2419620.1 hypothetical protein [Microbacterium imperiale]MDS0198514.1 DUF4349 domain-containing protein [Microbacterium imperiale]BFE39961.1 hypothetical protein GCM10017544_09170 [Microbacterium imperiale]GLJ79064.1 hypothetical protein GCM10017586_07460 [Microbacterium imperiale]